MYLQRVQKYTLSQFDDKRCYQKNIESKPWKWNCMNILSVEKEKERINEFFIGWGKENCLSILLVVQKKKVLWLFYHIIEFKNYAPAKIVFPLKTTVLR